MAQVRLHPFLAHLLPTQVVAVAAHIAAHTTALVELVAAAQVVVQAVVTLLSPEQPTRVVAVAGIQRLLRQQAAQASSSSN